MSSAPSSETHAATPASSERPPGAEGAGSVQGELSQIILENSTSCIFMMDARGYCTYMNRAGEQMFGWSLDEIRRQPLHDIIHHHHPDGRPYPMADCPIDRALPENFDIREHEDVFIRRDGTFFPVLVAASPIFDDSGRPVSTVIEVRDVTERRRAEAATLRRSEQLRRLAATATQINAAADVASMMRLVAEEARALVDAHQAVVSTVADGHWAEAIDAVALSSQYVSRDTATTPATVTILDLFAQTRKPVRLTRGGAATHPGFMHSHAATDDYKPLQGLLAVPMSAQDGRTIGLIQLTDKQEGEFDSDDEAMLVQLAQLASVALENQYLYAKEQAARARAEEASRLKDEFLATISHELRTPLTAFLGYGQLLQRRKHDEEYVARTVDKMVQSALVQAQLVEDLLDVSQIASGKFRLELQPLDFATVIHAAIDTIRPTIAAKALQLEVDLGSAASTINGDAGRLQQVVWNLLSNAAKFTPSGGKITVRLQIDEHEACLSVSDTGQGIRLEFLPFVFDRFRQADSTTQRVHGGLGLGLAIVRHFVELHAGTVTAASPGPGQGAVFTVRLPLAIGQTTPAPTSSADNPGAMAYSPQLSGVRVLVVDDNPAILELLNELLASSGATVQTRRSAREGLEAVRTWRPDVLISDISMPGEDGYWLIRSIRALALDEGGATPAVALTAYVSLEHRLRVLAAGFQQYVPKPVEPGELQAVVARLVSKDASF